MRIPKLDTANGYSELVPQSRLHQLIARLVHFATWYLFLEASKTLTRLATEDFARAIGPAEKLLKISTPAERRRARDGLARLDRDVAGVETEDPWAPGQGPRLECQERFLGDYDVWRACTQEAGHDGEHSDVPAPCGERFLGQDLDWHHCTIPGAHQKTTRHHMREQAFSDGATIRLIYETIDHLDGLAAEVEPETTEA